MQVQAQQETDIMPYFDTNTRTKPFRALMGAMDAFGT